VLHDWGLSAEFVALLDLKVVQNLLKQSVDIETYNQKKYALSAALLKTFDYYYKSPEIFRFTHGVSFSQVMHIFDKGTIKPAELEKLDTAISEIRAEGITEKGLLDLIKKHIIPETDRAVEVDERSLKDMLLVKLESGEYTPDGVICDENQWKRRIQNVVDTSTIDFYDSELGLKYVERYGPNPKLIFIANIKDKFNWPSGERRVALDVGCGPGQYAKLLKEQLGFEVKLLDASRKMLEIACSQLGIPTNSFLPMNIFDRGGWGYRDSYFDLIFACAMMVHVPKEYADGIYKIFYRLLKPDGVLFVNFKIGDHSLISEDGRFFEYYRNESL
jgi:hypothetical protein